MAYKDPDDIEIDWEMCDRVADEQANPLHVEVQEEQLIPVAVLPPTPPAPPEPVIPPQPRGRDYMNNQGHDNYRPERTRYFCVPYTDRTQAGAVASVPDYLAPRGLHDLEGSLTTDGFHAPCIDLDFPCALRETSPGHYHLFLQTKLTWPEYERLLTVMEEIGLVQRRVLEVARERGQTMVFVPGRKLELQAKGIIPNGANSAGPDPVPPAQLPRSPWGRLTEGLFGP